MPQIGSKVLPFVCALLIGAVLSASCGDSREDAIGGDSQPMEGRHRVRLLNEFRCMDTGRPGVSTPSVSSIESALALVRFDVDRWCAALQ